MSRLSLYLLGSPRIERDGVPIQVDTRKAIALLSYLAVTGERHRRDALVNLLWSEYDQSHGRGALRRTLSALRKALVDDWLDVDRENIGLGRAVALSTGSLGFRSSLFRSGQPEDAELELWTDVDQFRAHLAQCREHDHIPSEVCPACLSPLSDAVVLYRDDFLRGFTLKDCANFDDWQFFQGDALRRELAGALERLVDCHSAQGAFEPAISYAARWLALDRLHEHAHCELMRLYAWSGRRSAALRQYQECARILENQLNVSPQESTTALYQAIQQGRLPSPPTDQARRSSMEEKTGETSRRPAHTTISGKQFQAPRLPTSSLEEEKRIVTVVFAQVGLLPGGKKDLGAENEASRIADLLPLLKDTLRGHEGRVERVLGSNVLAVFGMAQTHESDPELAIRAAIEIRERTRECGLNLSVGVDTGQVYLRKGDNESGKEPAVVGTAVDLAIRLAGQTWGGQILASESTYRLTRGAFEYTSLSLDIQGLDEPLKAYRVGRLLFEPKKARGIEGLRTELIGRDWEFTKLGQVLDQVLAGQGQMVSLIGEAGVGKSRLVAELRELSIASRANRPPPLWLEGRCLERETAASYAPFSDILREYFAWRAEENDRRRRESVVFALQRMVKQGSLSEEHSRGMGPLLGRLLSVHWRADGADELECSPPEQIRYRTFAAVHDFFLALSKQRPVVLVFEDLHWADNLSLDLISLLMEAIHLGPLLLLCVYRPERDHKCWHLGTIAAQKCRARYTELRLRELTTEQSQQLVESLLTSEALSSSVRDRILDRSQGNPFFIEEVVHSLIDARVLYWAGDSWRVREELDTAVVPDSVQSVILSRIDHLPESWRRVLQMASVIGRLFRRRVLAQALQQGQDLERALWELESRALVYQERTVPEVEYSFKHVLTQEAVYRNIPRRRRAVLHRQVARAIEEVYKDGLDPYYEQLAYHAHAGIRNPQADAHDPSRRRHVEKAIGYLLKAAGKAKRSYANEEAIAHLARCLALLRTMPETPERDRRELDLQLALGVPLVLTRGHAAPEVEETYARARMLSERTGDDTQRFQVLLGLRRFYSTRGQLRAREMGGQLLALAKRTGDPGQLSRAHMMCGETAYYLGEFVQSREHAERGIALYEPGHRLSHVLLYGNDTRVFCWIEHALALWHLGYPDQALQSMCEALDLSRDLSHPFTLVCALYFAGLLHGLRREMQRAREYAEETLRVSKERGYVFYTTWGTVSRGWALAEEGLVDKGIDQMQAGIAAWRMAGAETALPASLAYLAKVYGGLGRTDEAQNSIDEALALVEKNSERCWEAELYRLRGELLPIGGEAHAEACFQRALDVARRQSARSWELRAATSLARLWHGQGKRAQARELLQGVYDRFSEGFDTVDLRESKALLDVLE